MKKRLDVLEVTAVVGIAIVATGILVSRHYERGPIIGIAADVAEVEIEPLERRYGPGYSSQFAEEWIVRDFFQDRRDGVFVDVGANHYKNDSVTYYLETALGWSGIAIDAQPEYEAEYRLHRPRTRFFARFVSDRDEGVAELFVPKGRPLEASASRSDGPAEARTVRTVTMNTLLAGAGIARIDLMNMDIEDHEPQALAGFDIDRYKPGFVCIEAHPVVRQQILDYFHAHQYVLAGKYLRADSINLYFAPASGR